ncbi:MAG: hypothetical protein Q9170_002449 [Blastenia crenularia]
MMETLARIVAMLLLASTVAANPLPTPASSYTPATKTYKLLADFCFFNPDGSWNCPNLAEPYKHLTWSNVRLESPLASFQYKLASDPQYISNRVENGRSSLSINGTKSSSFDVTEFYASCLADGTDPYSTAYDVVKCQFSVQCDKRPGGVAGPFLFKYTPAYNMTKYKVDLRNCSTAYLDIGKASGGHPFMVFDNFKIVAREGEVF